MQPKKEIAPMQENPCHHTDAFQTPINHRLTLLQQRNGLTFGTDAYLLYAYLRRRPRAIAADFGSGSGVVSLLCAAADVYAKIHAVELQPAYSALVAQNAANNKLSDRITVHTADVRDLTVQQFGKPIDAVFSNPPYFLCSDGLQSPHESKAIARHANHGDIDAFCAAAARILKYGGLLTVVYVTRRLDALCAALHENHFALKRLTFVYPTADHAPCLLLAEAKKSGAPGVYQTPPLILRCRDANGAWIDTEAHQYIYEHGVFPDVYFQP